jgi:hypothetical protein
MVLDLSPSPSERLAIPAVRRLTVRVSRRAHHPPCSPSDVVVPAVPRARRPLRLPSVGLTSRRSRWPPIVVRHPPDVLLLRRPQCRPVVNMGWWVGGQRRLASWMAAGWTVVDGDRATGSGWRLGKGGRSCPQPLEGAGCRARALAARRACLPSCPLAAVLARWLSVRLAGCRPPSLAARCAPRPLVMPSDRSSCPPAFRCARWPLVVPAGRPSGSLAVVLPWRAQGGGW